MQAHQLSPSYFVSPQISEADIAEISSAGFKSIICNRPDYENPHEFQITTLRAAALKFGLQFAENTIDGSNLGMDNLNNTGSSDMGLLNAQSCSDNPQCSGNPNSLVGGQVYSQNLSNYGQGGMFSENTTYHDDMYASLF